jgi:flagellar hook-associated protein 1 FlgK
MDVASNNIANVGNADYTRQRAVLSTENTEHFAGVTWGSGVKMDDITRIRSSLTDNQIISNNQRHSFHEKSSVLLKQVEDVYSEPSELGIANLMGQFFSSWSELSANPTSSALRGNVVYSAQNLAAKVEEINESYDVIKKSISYEFDDKVREVNNLLSNLQDVNRQLSETRSIGNNGNDLMDKRDVMIDSLSKLVNITVNYESDDTVNISIGGVFAVDKASYTKFEATTTDGKLKMVSVNGQSEVRINNGEMGALADTFSNKIPEYENKLNSVITQLVNSVNAAHNTGYTNEDPAQVGFDFFETYDGDNLKVRDEIINDHNKIAASADGTNGNGDIAIKIFEIGDSNVLNGSKLVDVYSNLISEVGSSVQNADRMAESSSIVLQQLQNQKDSVSAVSVDEEMMDVLKFQKAYEASARLIRIADEMLDTLINMV